MTHPLQTYIVSYDLKDADSAEYSLLECVLKKLDKNAQRKVESVWKLSSRIETANDLLTRITKALKALRKHRNRPALSAELICARVVDVVIFRNIEV